MSSTDGGDHNKFPQIKLFSNFGLMTATVSLSLKTGKNVQKQVALFLLFTIHSSVCKHARAHTHSQQTSSIRFDCVSQAAPVVDVVIRIILSVCKATHRFPFPSLSVLPTRSSARQRTHGTSVLSRVSTLSSVKNSQRSFSLLRFISLSWPTLFFSRRRRRRQSHTKQC